MGLWMQVLAAKRPEGNFTERYLTGIKNKNGEHLVNICESNILERYAIPSELARTLFPVELKAQMTKMKISHHSVIIEDECIHLWILADSVSVPSSFKCSQWWCVWKKIFHGEIIFHFKRIGTKRTCGLVVFVERNTQIFNGTNFKTFLK